MPTLSNASRRSIDLFPTAGRLSGLALLAALAAASAQRAPAGPIEDLAAQVSVASYRHILDDLLYTHPGHNRGYGAEHDLARQNIFDHFTSLGFDTSLFPF